MIEVLDKPRVTSNTKGIVMPRIGAPLADGIFAGLVRGTDGDHALVLLAAAPKELNWKAANKWAAEEGASLPTRAELSVIFGNLRDEFPNGGWHWSCEPFAGNESYAWYQSFYYSDQGYGHKDDELRARAVRRLPLVI